MLAAVIAFVRSRVSAPLGLWVQALKLVMDYRILFLDSVPVGQFAKKNRSQSFVRSVAFPVAVNRGMHSSQLSQTRLLPRSQTVVNQHTTLAAYPPGLFQDFFFAPPTR